MAEIPIYITFSMRCKVLFYEKLVFKKALNGNASKPHKASFSSILFLCDNASQRKDEGVVTGKSPTQAEQKDKFKIEKQ